MREAGYTVLSISQSLGVSVRSLQRLFSDYGIKKGKIKQAAVEAARTELLKHISCNDSLKQQAAQLIADDLAHARHLRMILVEASEQLKANTLKDASVVMRAAAAYSTALKNTSDMLRHSLHIDSIEEERIEAMPELVIQELTAAEVTALREKQAEPEELEAA